MKPQSESEVKVLAKRVQGMDDYALGILTQVCLFETAIRFPEDFIKMVTEAVDNVVNNEHIVKSKSLERIEDMLK